MKTFGLDHIEAIDTTTLSNRDELRFSLYAESMQQKVEKWVTTEVVRRRRRADKNCEWATTEPMFVTMHEWGLVERHECAWHMVIQQYWSRPEPLGGFTATVLLAVLPDPASDPFAICAALSRERELWHRQRTTRYKESAEDEIEIVAVATSTGIAKEAVAVYSAHDYCVLALRPETVRAALAELRSAKAADGFAEL